MKSRIRLKGINGDTEGKDWESATILRAGRLDTLEIVLEDSSVSRRHAEVRAIDKGWMVYDLDSTNGTFLNGQRIVNGGQLLHSRDVLQLGKVTLLVEVLDGANGDPDASHAEAAAKPPTTASQVVPKKTKLRIDDDGTGSYPDQIMVEATRNSSYEDALQGLAFDRNKCLRPGEQLQALLRASHYLGHLEHEEELLHSVLNDAVNTLDAQRGAIVLADGPKGALQLRSLATGRNDPGGRPTFSHSIAHRCFSLGESILCTSVNEDPELSVAQSIHEGAMGSVLCVLLRTPRNRLGVIHLDRSYWQNPFTEDDLHLADALAASVSAGIECAQLLRKQRELFHKTISVLSQAVETRDHYTGRHTARVTQYAKMLGQQLNVSPNELYLLEIGTPLHDIGKIGIDDAILRNPNKLTEEEFAIMKTHTIKGAAIIATIPELVSIMPIVRSHHEKWNGKGYPDGLAGEQIPLLARIVAVADAFDAMTSDRPYREAMSPQTGFAELEKQSGQHFAPECTAAFLSIREEILAELNSKSPANDKTLIGDALAPPLTPVTPTRLLA